MSDALIQAYNEQSKEVQRLAYDLERANQALNIRQTKGKQKSDNVHNVHSGNKRYAMVMQIYGSEVEQSMTEREIALLTILIHRMEMNTNIIVNRKTGERMSLADIAEAIGWTKKKTMLALDRLNELGVIHKCRKGVYTYYIIDIRYAICGNVSMVMQIIESSIKQGND